MAERFQDSLNKLVEKLSGWLDAAVLALPNILLAIIILVSFILAARKLKKIAQKLLHKTSANRTVVGFLSNFVVAVFMVIALFVILNVLNLSDAVTALLGTAGVAGLAMGLALQGPLVNLFSGVLMSVREYYKVGDLVETNDYFGKIEKINLRSTVIKTPDGQDVIIPNKDVLENPLKNYSHTTKRRIDLVCGVAYGDDLEKVKVVTIEALQSAELGILNGSDIEFYFTEFGESSINFIVRFWAGITAQSDFLAARGKAIMAIKNAFDQNDITIPFPIRTLDFGVVGGLRLDAMYPINQKKESGNWSIKAKSDGNQKVI